MTRKSTIFLLAALAWAGACTDAPAGSAKDTRAAVSAPAGILKSNLSRIDEVLGEEVDKGIRSGYVAMVAHRGKVAHTTAVGKADIENDLPMTPDTRFRIASMTKPITTVALLQLVEEGKVLLNDPVARYIPGFGKMRVITENKAGADGSLPTAPSRTPMTVHHLLTHTAGLGYVFDTGSDLGKVNMAKNLYGQTGDLGDRIDTLADIPLYEEPGTTWRYSYATDVAGRVVEVASGQTLEAYMKEHIFEPLGMTNTEFSLDASDLKDTAVVYVFGEDGTMTPFEGSSLGNPNTNGAGWMTGGSGLISTAGDYMRFCLMLLGEGSLDGKQILSPATVKLMMSDHLPDSVRPDFWKKQGASFGLGGLVILEPGHFGKSASRGQFSWGGYYDTSFFVSPADELAVVVLAQRQPGPHDPVSRASDMVSAIAYGALAK